MTEGKETICIVDDDPAVRRALARLLRSVGLATAGFSSAKEFLELETIPPGCLVLDVAMPGLNGLELQQALAVRSNPLPVIFLTGHGDLPMGVQAMKRGAVDFLTKPVNDTELLQAVQTALERDRITRRAREEVAEIVQRLATLTPREREVMAHVIAGQPNKTTAAELGTAEKTIKVHRARIMAKMQVQSVAELVRQTERAGFPNERV